MIEVKTILRKWGNSFGIVIPQKSASNGQIREGDEVIVLLKKDEKENILKEMFGTLKLNKSTDKILKEMDKELWNI